ncbi:hypothetical protein ACFOHS_00380 [Jhaorihella thermophila]
MQASTSREEARKLKNELDTTLQFSLEDPIRIEGVERVLGYTQFENYVLQLSKGRRFTSWATAIKIARAKDLHLSMPSTHFRDILHDVAYAIAKLTKANGNILSYRGNGTFLCISDGKKKTPFAGMEEQMNRLLATLVARRQINANVELIVGEAFRCGR